jgi:hypothetical protein
MPEGLRAELAGAEARTLRHAIKQPVDVPEPPLFALRSPGRDEQRAPALEPRAKDPGAQNRLQLWPEGDHPV